MDPEAGGDGKARDPYAAQSCRACRACRAWVKSGVPKDLCCFSLEMGGRNSRGSPVSSALGAPFGAELLDFRVDESPDMSFTKPVSVLYGGVVIQPDTNRFWCPYFFHF